MQLNTLAFVFFQGTHFVLVHAIPKGHEGLEVRCTEFSFSHVATAQGNPNIGIPQTDLNRSGQEEVSASCRHQKGFS